MDLVLTTTGVYPYTQNYGFEQDKMWYSCLHASITIFENEYK